MKPISLEPALVTPPPLDFGLKVVLLVPGRTFLEKVRTAASELGMEPFREKRFLADAVPLHVSGSVGLIGPFLGAPAAVVALEPLLCGGVKNVLLFGAAGGLADTPLALQPTDLFLPEGSVSEEGTSQFYGAAPQQEPLQSTLRGELECALASAHRQGTLPAPKRGIIWSTDAPFRETRAKVDTYRAQGANAVEMEFAAVQQLCRVYEAELGALFLISDLLGEEWQPSFNQLKRSPHLPHAAKLILALAVKTGA